MEDGAIILIFFLSQALRSETRSTFFSWIWQTQWPFWILCSSQSLGQSSFLNNHLTYKRIISFSGPTTTSEPAGDSLHGFSNSVVFIPIILPVPISTLVFSSLSLLPCLITLIEWHLFPIILSFGLKISKSFLILFSFCELITDSLWIWIFH